MEEKYKAVSSYWLKLSRSSEDQRGAAMLEFVISFLPFFIVLMGAFGIMQLAYVYGAVEYMANEAAQISTLPGTSTGLNCDGATPDDSRNCKVYNRLRQLAPGNSAVYLTVLEGAPCTKPAAVEANQILRPDGTALNPDIPFGAPRRLISVCIAITVEALPFNLLPIPIHVSGIAIGRNEPNV